MRKRSATERYFKGYVNFTHIKMEETYVNVFFSVDGAVDDNAATMGRVATATLWTTAPGISAPTCAHPPAASGDRPSRAPPASYPPGPTGIPRTTCTSCRQPGPAETRTGHRCKHTSSSTRVDSATGRTVRFKSCVALM